MAYNISSSTFSISSPMVIKNGTEGYGKILTTDASGLVVWKEPNSFFGTSRYIGELYGGGIVVDFWKEGDVENTLIMSLTHLSLDYVWSNVPTITTGSFDESSYSTGADSLYDGKYNSDLITRQQVIDQQSWQLIILASHTISAAKLCKDYKYGGYDDWYLPSYNEFNSIIKNKHIINRVLGDVNGIRSQNTGSGSALNGLYWTSTEYNESFTSYEESFPGGPIFLNTVNTQYGIQYSTSESRFKAADKNSNAMVRAVRREEKLTGNGLVLSLDAGNKNSYDDSNRGNIWYDLVNKGITASAGLTFSASATGATYSATNSGYFTFQNNQTSYIDFKADLGNTSVVTVEIFARIKNTYGNIFTWGTSGYSIFNGWELGFHTGGGDNYGISAQRKSDYGLENSWKHYVFVMRTDVSYTNNKIYVNGDLITLSVSAFGGTEGVKSFANGTGRINPPNAGNTNGNGMDLAILNIYKRELNQTEIVNNFNKYKKRFEVKESVYQKDLILNLNSNNINSFDPSNNLTTWYDQRIFSDISLNPPKNLTFVSTAIYSKSPGVYPGTYIDFNNNRASVATTITFNPSTTWEVWVKIDSLTPSINNMIMGQLLPYFGVSGGNSYKVIFSNSYSGVGGGSNQTYQYSNSSIITGKWYHLAFTTKYDSVSNVTTSKIYIDGVQNYSNTVTTNGAGTLNSDSIPGYQTNLFTSNRFSVGDGRDTNWQPFNGSLSEVRIYNRTLNASEIKNNYDSSKHLYDIDKNHYTHNFNTSPTFSVFQNLVLDFPNKQNNSILVSDNKGQVSLGTPSSIISDKIVKRSVGDLYAGGIIVSVVDYLLTTNYLIASLEDLPSAHYWSTSAGSSPEFSTVTSEFDGSYNTDRIKTSLGAGSYAAMTASVYNYGGYTDWYLPSSNELREAYNNISVLNLVLGKNSLKDTYWSSSESTYGSEVYPNAFAFNFGSVLYESSQFGVGPGATSSGLEFQVGKYNLLKVRPFRTQINNNYTSLIMVIKTNNPGLSPANVINIPTNPVLSLSVYNYSVDWGDGTITTGHVNSINHTYATAGTYTIKISGRFPSIYYANTGDRLKILEIKNWGSIKWSTMEGAFYGCSNLIITATDAPDLSLVTNMNSMLRDCSSLNQSINHWNVSNVTNMSYLFLGCTIFNRPLNNWNVSNVQDMSLMFGNATVFNQPLNSWNTSAVTTMQGMFFGTAFNQPINSWNTALVQNMSFMFSNTSAFNQPLTRSGNSWNLQSVTDMAGMFYQATAFNKSLNSWNTLNVISMSGMFNEAISFNNGASPGVSSVMTLDTRSVNFMSNMFNSANSFNQSIATNGNIWNTSLVQDMEGMFRNNLAFNQNIGSWNISNVTDFDFFMEGKTPTTFSTTNLNAIYQGWSTRPVKPNISITFGTAKRTSASTATRSILTSAPNNWIITDGGIEF